MANQIPHSKLEGGLMSLLEEEVSNDSIPSYSLYKQEWWKHLQEQINAAKRLHKWLNKNLMEWRRDIVPIEILGTELAYHDEMKQILCDEDDLMKEIVVQHSFDRGVVIKLLPCFKNVGDQHAELSGIRTRPPNSPWDFNFIPYGKLKKQMNTTGNRFSKDNNESCIVIDTDLTEASIWDGKMNSNDSNGCNLNKYKENTPRGCVFQLDSTFHQHKSKKIAQRFSSFALATIAFLWIIFEICSQSSIMQLHKENGLIFIWFPLLELLSFMVFVWGVAIMILVGAQFSRMQSAMFIFWAILMLLKCAYASRKPTTK